MTSFTVVFLLLIGMVVYLVRSSTAHEEETTKVEQYAPPTPSVETVAPNLNKRKAHNSLAPGWYPSATGESETYFDGREWTETRPRIQDVVADEDKVLADERLQDAEEA